MRAGAAPGSCNATSAPPRAGSRWGGWRHELGSVLSGVAGRGPAGSSNRFSLRPSVFVHVDGAAIRLLGGSRSHGGGSCLGVVTRAGAAPVAAKTPDEIQGELDSRYARFALRPLTDRKSVV